MPEIAGAKLITADVPERPSARPVGDLAASHAWPNRAASRFVTTPGLEWHVQDFGAGPPILLLHGTGSTSHSWRDVAPALAGRFRVIVPDLPGHGRTSTPQARGLALPCMAAALRDLLNSLGVKPVVAVGHSAGAAILVRMALSNYCAPRVLISINGALLPLRGFPRTLFSPLAKLLARSSWVPKLVARRAHDRRAIEKLIKDTGSQLDEDAIRLYQRLVQNPKHVAAALLMMANWDLATLAQEIGSLRVPLKLLVANGDRTISPDDALRVRLLLPPAEVISLGHLGHLAHEEQPHKVAAEILRLAFAVCAPTAGRAQ